MNRDELGRFREYVESLEIAVDCLAAQTPARTRQALITLDNLGEVLMYEICGSLFEYDEFIARVMPPRFSAKQKSATRWGFHDKVALLETEGRLTGEHAGALRILHRYRTPAFHRHFHNPRSGWVVSFAALPSIVHLLSEVFGGTTIGGLTAGAEWLEKYGVRTDFVNFALTAQAIGRVLLGSISRTAEELRAALVADVDSRVSALEQLVREELFSTDPVFLDEILREEEFWSQFDDTKASAAYREIVYAITDRKENVSREEFQHREADYRARVSKAAAAFRGSLSMTGLRELHSRALMLGTEVHQALQSYIELDELLTRYEATLESAARKMDQAVQAEIDRRRGK